MPAHVDRHRGLRLSSLSVLLWLLQGTSCGSGHRADTGDTQVPLVERRDGHLFVPPDSPLRQRLEVAAVATENVRRALVAPATVEADPARTARIAPPLPGRIVKLFVHFGDAVKQGAPLFSLDSSDLVAAQSDYLKARSAAAQAERNVSRQKDLLEHGIGARRELEQAETDRDSAASELQRATTRLSLLGMDPGHVGGPLTVVSPVTGRVIDLNTAPGQYQNDPAAVLMTIADLSSIWVTANVQEKDVRRVHKNDEADAVFAAYPGEVFHGRVSYVGDLLDPQTRTIKARVAFDNPDFRLKPNMFATVTCRGPAVPEIVVPTTAVVISGERSAVYLETAPWTFERRTVETGEQQGAEVVVSQGLAAGARVITRNAVLLP